MKPLKIFAWISLVSGLLCAWLFGVMALDHNPQGEFRDQVTGAMHWEAFIPVIVMGFIYIAGVVFAALSLTLIAFRLIKAVIVSGRR